MHRVVSLQHKVLDSPIRLLFRGCWESDTQEAGKIGGEGVKVTGVNKRRLSMPLTSFWFRSKSRYRRRYQRMLKSGRFWI